MHTSLPLVTPVFYSAEFGRAALDFPTIRKAAWIAESLGEDPIAGMHLVEPLPVDESDLLRVHDEEYVAAVRTGQPRALAESQGFSWESALWTSVLASTGGVVAAARAALKSGGVAGSLSSGLHHARRDRGSGYCTFNGLALAAIDALEAGVRRVLILDLDAHCGGGTDSILAGRDGYRHVDVSVNGFDAYDGPPGSALDIVAPDRYLATVRRRLADLDRERASFDLCLYNAGMDAFDDGVSADVLARREGLVFRWCRRRGLPVAFVLAGGYSSRETLVGLHRLTLRAASTPELSDDGPLTRHSRR